MTVEILADTSISQQVSKYLMSSRMQKINNVNYFPSAKQSLEPENLMRNVLTGPTDSQNNRQTNSLTFDVMRSDIGKKLVGSDLVMKHRSFRTLQNSSLIIVGATRDFQGRYLCRASNGVGSDLSTVITVTVHGKNLVMALDQICQQSSQ